MFLTMEIWKSVVGYEDRYDISNLGRVKSLPRKGASGRILKPSKMDNDYLYVGLRKNGIKKSCRVHRLVLIAFRGSSPEGTEASHLDGDSINNHLSNLIWESHSNNLKRAKKGWNNHAAKLTEIDIPTIRSRIASGETQREVAKSFRVSQGAISCIIRRKTWGHIS